MMDNEKISVVEKLISFPHSFLCLVHVLLWIIHPFLLFLSKLIISFFLPSLQVTYLSFIAVLYFGECFPIMH